MTENRELTTAQKQALDAYRRHCDKNQQSPPTVRELAGYLGKSPNAAFALIGKLREKGYLTMKPVTTIRPRLTAKAKKAQ